jgi:hypothetical protein
MEEKHLLEAGEIDENDWDKSNISITAGSRPEEK